MTTLLRGAAIAAVIVATTTCLGAVPSVGSVGGPGSERIVTSALLAGGGAAVTTMAPDGSGVAKVDVPADLEDFNRSVWSHDGTRLLHSNVLVFDDSGELVAFRPALSAPDGSDYRLLRLRHRPMDFYCSAWSPDDSRILCTDIEGGVISIRATDGRGARRLTTNPFGGKDLAIGYSPDGDRVAWVREGPGSTDELERAAIFVGDADGTHARRLTRWGLLNAHELAGASWSPDGSAFVAATRRGGLVTVDAAAGGATPVPVDLGTNAFAVMPDYSPDGQRLVFAMFRDRPSDLWVVNLDGTGLRRITRTPDRSELAPDWK
jgi:Tol biopolymer transport system component